jgi:heme exporter protein A
MISLEHITYSTTFDNTAFLAPDSFTALPGAIVKISGHNGAGKTTFLRIIAGIIKPQTGDVIHTQSNVNYIGHRLGIKDDYTPREQLLFWAGFENSEMLIPAALKITQLEDVADIFCYKLSAGNKQKLAIAKLLISSTNIWVLDEIDSALDDANTALLSSLMATKANNGGIIFFSSHRDVLPFSFKIEI